MVEVPLKEVIEFASKFEEPRLTPPSTVKAGGVDPLGLREINFDLMNEVFPGLNNVARHIRPFVVVTWAWRRAKQIAEFQNLAHVSVEDLQDFVDRIEVIYAWSQFLRKADADLPGRNVLVPIVQSSKWQFGGDSWNKLREGRRDSTAFTAAITYGPALKSMGWVKRHKEHASILIPTDFAQPALDAFERRIKDVLNHPAFNKFGFLEVTREEALSFAEAWALEDPTEPERLLVSEILCGTAAPRARREACSLMLAAAAYTSSKEVATIRTAMAGHPSPFKPSSELETISGAWRRVQVRQLFRLSLEAIFYWLLKEIEFGRRTTSELVDTFLTRQNSRSEKNSAKEWLDPSDLTNMGPTHLIDRIAIALSDPTRANLSSTISDGLAFCLTGLPEQKNGLDRSDRLPLSRAHSEARAWGPGTTRSFVSHIFEDWVIGQHVYWSVGRGLADARALGKTILQLRVVLEDGGWTLTPGASAGSPPFVTPDRIQTALSLANECKLIIA